MDAGLGDKMWWGVDDYSVSEGFGGKTKKILFYYLFEF
jgi:hypothetical protein